MKSLLLFAATSFILFSCNQKKDDKKHTEKKTTKSEYTITNDGIGEIKIGMKDTELEKILDQKFNFEMMVDSPGYWMDTVRAKYKEIDVELLFERLNGDSDSTYMQLFGVQTNSSLCKTTFGAGVGDDRATILEPYDDRSIFMGPDWEMINDTTWEPSKTKYTVSVKDDQIGRELNFHLVNKKVVSLGVSIAMGE